MNDKPFENHVLTELSGGPFRAIQMKRPDCGFHAVRIIEFSSRLCITGDVIIGGNGYGIFSANRYDLNWFGSELSPDYLCEKFFFHGQYGSKQDKERLCAIQRCYHRLTQGNT